MNCDIYKCGGTFKYIGTNRYRQQVYECTNCKRRFKDDCSYCIGSINHEYEKEWCSRCMVMRAGTEDNFKWNGKSIQPSAYLLDKQNKFIEEDAKWQEEYDDVIQKLDYKIMECESLTELEEKNNLQIKKLRKENEQLKQIIENWKALVKKSFFGDSEEWNKLVKEMEEI